MRSVVSLGFALLLTSLSVLLTSAVRAQPPAPIRIVSPEVAADRSVTFRIPAPNATAVSLQSAGDMPQVPFGGGLPMTQDADGLWEVTVQLDPGAYRYNFSVDGSAWMDANAVQHGALSEVNYASSTLNRTRRMHVYTPPGFKAGTQYPVRTDRAHTAIAGLSMGGAQTLDAAATPGSTGANT